MKVSCLQLIGVKGRLWLLITEGCLHLFSSWVVICFTLQKEGGDLACDLKHFFVSLKLFIYYENHEFPGIAVMFFTEWFLNIPVPSGKTKFYNSLVVASKATEHKPEMTDGLPTNARLN